jgi:hypothetical protein
MEDSPERRAAAVQFFASELAAAAARKDYSQLVPLWIQIGQALMTEAQRADWQRRTTRRVNARRREGVAG